MPEVTINSKTPAVKDKVYFPGKANLSDKEAEAFTKATAKAAETAPATTDTTEGGEAPKGRGKRTE